MIEPAFLRPLIRYRYVNVKSTLIDLSDVEDGGMITEGPYEIRVRVKTLADTMKIIQLLDSAGYRDVEMGPPMRPFPPRMFARMAETVRGRVNKVVLRAIQCLGAVDKDHGVTVDKIVKEMKRDPEFGDMVRCSPEGVLERTVAMIAPAVLAERHGWVSYDPGQFPRRFWLTPEGIRELKR